MYASHELIREPLLLEPLRRSVVDGAIPQFLRSAKIKITARCNLKCVMCKYGRGLSPPELDGAQFIQIVRDMAKLGCQKIHLSGGEVLARRDFESILEAAVDAGMKSTLTSNLTLLTRERARRIMETKVSSISTSLDGAEKRTHDAIRGMDGAFRKTTRAIERLVLERTRARRRTKIRVNHVIMRDNFREYPALIRLAANLGVTEVHPMPVDEKTTSARRLSRRLIAAYNAEVAPLVREERQRAGFALDDASVFPFGSDDSAMKEASTGRYAQHHYRDHLCYAPWTHLFVRWDGETALCCMTNGRIESLGNVFKEGVEAVFLGEKFQAIRKTMRKKRLDACHRCDMFLDENRVLDLGIAPPVLPRKTLPVLSAPPSVTVGSSG